MRWATRAAWCAIGGGGSSKMDARFEDGNEASRRSKLQDRNSRVRGGMEGSNSMGGRVNTSDQVPDIRHLQSRSRLPVAPLETAPRNAPSRPIRVVIVVVRHRHAKGEVRPGYVVVVVVVVFGGVGRVGRGGGYQALSRPCFATGGGNGKCAGRDVGLRCAAGFTQ